MPVTIFEGRPEIRVRALCLGERIDLRALETGHRLAVGPLVLPAGATGCTVLFRYGAVVLFDLELAAEVTFLRSLRPVIHEPFERADSEEILLRLELQGPERVDNGIVFLQQFSLERIQVVADILAKSVVLAHYELGIAAAFDAIDPLAKSLQMEGRAGRGGRELLRHLGGSLLMQHKMVWRAEVGEKPEVLWENPELERLYPRLAEEYELRERHLALERKLDLIARTAQTLLDLLQHQRSLRVEWYIVVLILVEILLTVYAMFLHA